MTVGKSLNFSVYGLGVSPNGSKFLIAPVRLKVSEIRTLCLTALLAVLEFRASPSTFVLIKRIISKNFWLFAIEYYSPVGIIEGVLNISPFKRLYS